MGMTMTQKILAAHAGVESVKAGQLIQAKLDVVMGNDITTAVALKEFKKTGAKEVFDKEKVVIVLDHFTPNKDIHHTHEGSIGNLCNDRIQALMDEAVKGFNFGKMETAIANLLKD